MVQCLCLFQTLKVFSTLSRYKPGNLAEKSAVLNSLLLLEFQQILHFVTRSSPLFNCTPANLVYP